MWVSDLVFYAQSVLLACAVLPFRAKDMGNTQSANVQSVNLRGFEGCDDYMRVAIKNGWEDAISMAHNVKDDINFNNAAELQFLGPPGYNLNRRENIQAVFEKASGFGQGSWRVPAASRIDVYVRCDDRLDKCKSGAPAYTENKMKNQPDGPKPKTVQEHREASPVITYCPSYFDMKRLDELISSNQKEDLAHRVNLDHYQQNTGM
jgi:hypothetical protein